MTRGTTRAGIVLAGGILLSRMLGLVRDALFSGLFPGDQVSVFLYSQRVPFALAQLLLGGLTAILVPELAARLAGEDKARAERLANVALTYALCGFFALALALMGLAHFLGLLVAPGLPAQQQTELAALLREVAWLVFFNGTGGLLFALLQATERFTPLAIAQVMPNLALVTCIALLAHSQGIKAAVIGVLIGGLLYCLVLVAGYRHTGLRFKFSFKLEDTDFLRLLGLSVPLILVMSGFDLGMYIQGMLASGLGGHRYDLLSYAYRIAELPFGIFVIALFTVLFPQFAKSAAKQQLDKLKAQVQAAVRMSLFLVLPAGALLLALAQPVVQLLLQHGHFAAGETEQTMRLVQVLAGWMIARSLLQLALAVYFALEEVLALVVWQMVGVGLIYGFGLALRGLGLEGLALGAVLAGTLEVTGLGLTLRYKYGSWGLRKSAWLAVVFCVPSALLAVTAWWVHKMFALVLGAGFAGQGLALIAAVLAGLGVFLVTAYALRLEELRLLVEAIRSKGGQPAAVNE